jgi:hypothetical protein
MKATDYMGDYLKKEAISRPQKLTVARCEDGSINEGEPSKLILFFKEIEKGLVMNKTNLRACVDEFGTDETEQWVGKEIVIYSDPNVAYRGKRVGGLRLRGVRSPAPQIDQKPEPIENRDDQHDIPF